MPFQFKSLSIPDVVLVAADVYSDPRGQFFEAFKSSYFTNCGITLQIVQISQSKSKMNVLRGLHYQLNPKAQGKLVQATAGTVFDVAVDIRQGSPYFGKWVGQMLVAESKNLFWIPEGFAHGYCALSEDAEVTYYCTEEWAPDNERGILWNDPTLNIKWPIQQPILSDKDRVWPRLAEADINFNYSG